MGVAHHHPEWKMVRLNVVRYIHGHRPKFDLLVEIYTPPQYSTRGVAMVHKLCIVLIFHATKILGNAVHTLCIQLESEVQSHNSIR